MIPIFCFCTILLSLCSWFTLSLRSPSLFPFLVPFYLPIYLLSLLLFIVPTSSSLPLSILSLPHLFLASRLSSPYYTLFVSLATPSFRIICISWAQGSLFSISPLPPSSVPPVSLCLRLAHSIFLPSVYLPSGFPSSRPVPSRPVRAGNSRCAVLPVPCHAMSCSFLLAGRNHSTGLNGHMGEHHLSRSV